MASPIVFALDFPTVDEARAAAREVAPAVGMLKVGLELFIHAGRDAVALGTELGLPVFLDLKLHDIPETVERAVTQASRLGARLVTVHASGGRQMLRRAVARAKEEGGSLDVCAVTILTSLDDRDLREIGIGARPDDFGIGDTRRLRAFGASATDDGAAIPRRSEAPSATSLAARSLAQLAYEEGVRWFVCSPAEVAELRKTLGPAAVLVTPGVRPSSAALGDQKRVATPEQAVKDGANWLVVGRPIRDASDRLGAAKAIAASVAPFESAQ